MNFNYKRNLVSRSTLASSFTSSIYTFKYSHLLEPGVEGQKLPHTTKQANKGYMYSPDKFINWMMVNKASKQDRPRQKPI